MPNWCENSIVVTGKYEDIIPVYEALKANRFCEHLVPTPQEMLANNSWYDWRVDNWGTKWDIEDPDCVVERNAEDATLLARFESAWAPPTSIYDELHQRGFTVKAYWYEPAMAFAGIYNDGLIEEYELPETAQEVKETIPPTLDEEFDISYQLESQEQG